MEYTSEQLEAIDKGRALIDRGKPGLYRIGGYAGTGKTTVMREIIVDRDVHIASSYGKAVGVLWKKGVTTATTIHRMMYRWDDDREEFFKLDRLNCRAVAIDEGGTVGSDIWCDLQSYNLPVVVMGDPAQLEPVGDDAHLMDKPDILLSKIHRYQGSIAWYAEKIRQGEIPTVGCIQNTDECSVLHERQFMDDLRAVTDWKNTTVICGFNRTRVAVNKQIRALMKRTRAIEVGDRLIALSNSQKLGTFNGQTMEVLTHGGDGRHPRYGQYSVATVRFDDGRIKHDLKLWHEHLGLERPIDWRKHPKDMAVVDYGNCCTVHKFQGSEDDNILYLDEHCELWSHQRARYTGVTRAAKSLKHYVDQ